LSRGEEKFRVLPIGEKGGEGSTQYFRKRGRGKEAIRNDRKPRGGRELGWEKKGEKKKKGK